MRAGRPASDASPPRPPSERGRVRGGRRAGLAAFLRPRGRHRAPPMTFVQLSERVHRFEDTCASMSSRAEIVRARRPRLRCRARLRSGARRRQGRLGALHAPPSRPVLRPPRLSDDVRVGAPAVRCMHSRTSSGFGRRRPSSTCTTARACTTSSPRTSASTGRSRTAEVLEWEDLHIETLPTPGHTKRIRLVRRRGRRPRLRVHR